MRNFAFAFSIAIAFTVSAAGFVACSDNGGGNPVPPDGGPVVVIPGTDVLPPDAPSVDPTPPGDGGGVDGAPSCVAKPATNNDFLNSCTDGTCFPFANTKARLPLLKDNGELPPVP